MKLIALALLLLPLSILADDFLMPRETLKNDLKVYTQANSSSDVAFKVKQGASLKVVEVVGKWRLIELHDQRRGYVYKPSTEKFRTPLSYLERLAFERIVVFRSTDALYIHMAETCYVIEYALVETLPYSYDNKMTLVEYLDASGGIKQYTEAQADFCGHVN